MKLYGSTTSPYVRRLRVWMEDIDHEFIDINIYSPEGREVLLTINPALKIPMLLDDAQPVFDSRVIFSYLNSKLQKETCTVADENLVTLVNAANDSFVEMFLLTRSGVDTSQDALFFNLQRERITTSLKELDLQAQSGHLDNWNFAAISLYCLIDWTLFRELHDYSTLPSLKAFYDRHADKAILAATDPRVSA
ncbi:glutathione S-transferase family protein [Nitrincola sp. MINF-07-Sa-05]|uniref:glutathione S-transferase family protein n=1 Tax=Nitrincola salilacus TaxID=3400273 RepID=UPI003917C3E2